MALVGEVLDPEDEVCGVVASTRPKIDRLQVWTRGRDDVNQINALGKRIIDTLALEGRETENMSMEFQVSARDMINLIYHPLIRTSSMLRMAIRH